MNKNILLTLSAISLLSFAAVHAAEMENSSESGFKKTGPHSVTAMDRAEVQATVMKIDKKNRTLTLKDETGDVETIHVSDQVRNFENIKKGDVVKIGYLEALTLELKKNSDAPVAVTEDSDAARAEKGEKPAGYAAERYTATGVVTKVNKKTQEVTVKGPERTVTLHVKKPEVFKDIKVGDKIQATYTEAMAVSVESVKK